eukprot:gene11828-13789_t
MVALKTFQNLPTERQQFILNSALEEFALHDYESASLSNIISKLKLAKGSFYRYFENKRSLYFFLLDHCTKLRLDSDDQLIDRSATDFFSAILEHFKAKLTFDKLYPLHSAFIYNVFQERNNQELGDIQQLSKSKVIEIIKALLKDERDLNTLRTDLEEDIMAFSIFQLQMQIPDYIAFRYQIDYRKNIRNKLPLYHGISEEKLLHTAQDFIQILKRGIIKS